MGAGRGAAGKSLTPETVPGEAPNPFTPPPPQTLRSPEEVAGAASRRTTSRVTLGHRHGALGRVSPEVGRLDEAAYGEFAREDPDAAAALLADLAQATDAGLRAAARRLALRLALRPPAAGAAPTGRPVLATSADPDGADLDLDATLARLDASPRLRREDVRSRDWARRGSAHVLLVDVSGPVVGARLATAVLAAGALAAALRPGDQLGVVAFARDAVVVRPLTSTAPPSEALDRLLGLRSGGTTGLAHGLTVALAEAATARASRREVLVLTDGLHTDGPDPLPVARAAARSGARLHVLALAGSEQNEEAWEACQALATAGGGRCVLLDRPARAVEAVRSVTGGGPSG